MMDKKLARRNMRLGVTLLFITLAMFGVTFLWAALYLHFVQSGS